MHGDARVLFGAFGRVAALVPGNDLVPHAHCDAHLTIAIADRPPLALVGGREIRLTHDTALAINPYEVHSLKLPAGAAMCAFLTFYIRPEWLQHHLQLSPTIPFTKALLPIDAETQSLARSFFDTIELGNMLDDTLELEVELFLKTLLEAALVPSRQRLRAMHQARVDFRVRRAMVFMQQNLDARVTLEEVARHVGLSRPHFFVLFQEQIGMTPRIYWNTLRIEHALIRMRTHKIPLGDVAFDLGFSSQGNFSRFFREHTGVSPYCYRRSSA